MKIILATSNRGKIDEIKALWSDDEVVAYSEIMDSFEIVEDGKTYKENALKKARAIYEKICNKDVIVLADDSGISVEALEGKPNIYSARFAKIGASDEENRLKMIESLKAKNLFNSPAFYTASIVAISKDIEYSVHGFCYGEVIAEQRGKNGFGYDPLFIPKGYDKTLGELSSEVKKSLSHRVKALKLLKKVI